MKFRDVPVDAIVITGNTADGPFFARKLAGMVETGPVRHNAHWVTSDGLFQGVCILMEDLEVEIHSTDTATGLTDEPKPKQRTGRGSRRRGSDSGVPATGGDSSGESVG